MYIYIDNIPSLKLTQPLHMDGWKTIRSFWGPRPIFSGYNCSVSVREGIHLHLHLGIKQKGRVSNDHQVKLTMFPWHPPSTWVSNVSIDMAPTINVKKHSRPFVKVETEVGLAAVREMVKVEGLSEVDQGLPTGKKQETAGGYIIRISYIYI